MNVVFLSGYVGQEPKIYDGKIKVARISVATKRADVTDWHTVELFGNNATFVESYIKKGDYVIINGYLSNTSYKDKNGKEVKMYNIKANVIEKPKEQGSPSIPKHQNEEDIPY